MLYGTPIESFFGEFRFLSNFWPARVMLDDRWYPTVEHAYVAAKSRDIDHRKGVAEIPADMPGRVKRFGRTCKLRPDWDAVRLPIMTDLVFQKFSRHSSLGKLLLETGNRLLVEGNTWNDTFWGVCKGKGENNLGKILIHTRDRIRNGDRSMG